MNISKWAWIPATVVATISALTWVTATAWPIVGWESPKHHEAEVIELRKAIADYAAKWLAAEQDRVQTMKGLSNQLSCGQWEARLRDLMRQQQEKPRDVDIQREIEVLRERMAAAECSKYG